MARDYAKYNAKRRVSSSKTRYPDIYIIITLLVVICVTGGWVYEHKLKGAFSRNAQLAHAVDNLQSFFHHKKSEKNAILPIQGQTVAEQDQVRFDFYNELPSMHVKVSPAMNQDKKSAVAMVRPKAPILVHSSTITPIAASMSGRVNDASVKRMDSALMRPAGSVQSVAVSGRSSATLAQSTGVTQSELSTVNSPVQGGKQAYKVRVGHFRDANMASEMRISLLLVGFDAEIVKVGQEFYLHHGQYTTMAQAKGAQKKLQQKGFDGVVIKA